MIDLLGKLVGPVSGILDKVIEDKDEKEKTFALIAGKAMQAKDRKPLFSGVITEEMGTQLRILGNEIEEMTLRGQDE